MPGLESLVTCGYCSWGNYRVSRDRVELKVRMLDVESTTMRRRPAETHPRPGDGGSMNEIPRRQSPEGNLHTTPSKAALWRGTACLDHFQGIPSEDPDVSKSCRPCHTGIPLRTMGLLWQPRQSSYWCLGSSMFNSETFSPPVNRLFCQCINKLDFKVHVQLEVESGHYEGIICITEPEWHERL